MLLFLIRANSRLIRSQFAADSHDSHMLVFRIHSKFTLLRSWFTHSHLILFRIHKANTSPSSSRLTLMSLWLLNLLSEGIHWRLSWIWEIPGKIWIWVKIWDFWYLGNIFRFLGDFGPNFGFWIWGGDRRLIWEISGKNWTYTPTLWGMKKGGWGSVHTCTILLYPLCTPPPPPLGFQGSHGP